MDTICFPNPWHPCNAWSKDSALKTRFIVNLRSGRARQRFAAVQAFAARHGATITLTERARHASELAREAAADGCELIVAVGGDGTMNEVASALVGTASTLGLVPCGSGDGLARHLGVHGSMEHVFKILLHGRPRLIDSGMADGHPFFTVAGMGFEAEIGQRFNQLARRGFLRYLTTSVREYFASQPQEYRVTQDGLSEPFRAFTLAVCNADQYGNDAHIAPQARADDGFLNLSAIRPFPMWAGLPLAMNLFRGTLTDSKHVVLRRSAHFIIERERAGLLHTDGEIHQAGTRLEFTVRPASLRVMCPLA